MMHDLRDALRRLIAKPAFTAMAVMTLALGIGANTAIYGAAAALLVRPLPVPDGDRVVCGLALREGFDPFGTSLLEYAAYREASRAFSDSGLASQRVFTLAGRDGPERVQGAGVMAGYLAALAVSPIAGRALTADDDRPGAPPVAIVSYEMWQRRFGGDRAAIGAHLSLDGAMYTVVGVMPPGFDMPAGSMVWVPLQIALDVLPLAQRAATAHGLVARLKPGVSLADADARVKTIARQLEAEYPQYRRGWTYRLIPLRQYLLADLEGRRRLALLTLTAAVGCLLLICCANVASLLLAGGVAREREIAVRLALGASRRRVVRHLVVESAVLATLGGATGLLVATWLTPVLAALNPIRAEGFASFLGDFGVDGRVLLFTLAASAASGLLFGTLPAFTTSRVGDIASTLRKREQRSAGRSSRWLASLVVVEVAVAVILLVNGSLIAQSFTRLQRVDIGFDPGHLLTLELPLSEQKYPTHAARVEFVDRLLETVRREPGLSSAGLTTDLPLQSLSGDSVFTVEGRPPANPADVPITAHRVVTPAYLQTLGVHLVKGRLLDEHDRDGTRPVVVVTNAFAKQAWANDDPIGKRVRRGRVQDTTFPWLTVVGVVADVKEDRFNFRIDRPVWYLPYAQQPTAASLHLVVRSASDPAAMASVVRGAVRSLDPQQPISNLTTLTEKLRDLLVTERFAAVLMAALALLGLFLSACGLYGVIAYSASQRTSEIGLRMALGADRGSVLRLVMGSGVTLVAIGLAAGCVAARAVSVLLSSSLYGVTANDPSTFVAVGAVLTTVGLVACYLPAHRATQVDPLVALRTE